MVELGNKLTSGGGWMCTPDFKLAYKVHLPDAGRFLKMSAYCGGYTTSVYARCNIYSDKDDEPYHLLRSTENVLLPKVYFYTPYTALLVDFPFASPYPEILPSDIWLCFHGGPDGIYSFILNTGNGVVKNVFKYYDDFDDGSDEYWGSPQVLDTYALTLYATYELLPRTYATIRDSITLGSRLINPPDAGGYWIQGFWVRKVRARLDKTLANDHNIPTAVLQVCRDILKERII